MLIEININLVKDIINYHKIRRKKMIIMFKIIMIMIIIIIIITSLYNEKISLFNLRKKLELNNTFKRKSIK